jgi:hypothetical protein
MIFDDGNGGLVRPRPGAKLVKDRRTGVVYASQAAVAREFGVNTKTVGHWIGRPSSRFQVVSSTTTAAVLDLRTGAVYKSATAAGRALGVDYHTIHKWLQDPRSSLVQFKK